MAAENETMSIFSKREDAASMRPRRMAAENTCDFTLKETVMSPLQ